MSIYLWIGLGGFLGANVRYVLTVWVATRWGVTFPYGTRLINLSGSFLLCLLVEVLSTSLVLRPPLRLALTVGFLGAYTTFPPSVMNGYACCKQGKSDHAWSISSAVSSVVGWPESLASPWDVCYKRCWTVRSMHRSITSCLRNPRPSFY